MQKRIFVPTRDCISNSLCQDLNWELEVARRKKRWKAKENEIRTGEVRMEKTSRTQPE